MDSIAVGDTRVCLTMGNGAIRTKMGIQPYLRTAPTADVVSVTSTLETTPMATKGIVNTMSRRTHGRWLVRFALVRSI
jgi:hypothetical protein